MGGYENLLDKYSQSVPDAKYASFKIENGLNISCSEVRPDFAHLFHSIDDDFLPWTGVLSGMVIASIYYWCSDQVSLFLNQCCQLWLLIFGLFQVIVQRLLAAKNISHAKGGTVVAGLLKLLPFFTLVLPGMAARTLFTNEVL